MTNQSILEKLSELECTLYYRREGWTETEGVSAEDAKKTWELVKEALEYWHQVTGCKLGGSCYNCKHYFEDTSFNSCDCLKSDDLTEEQYEKHFVDDEPGCPYHEYKA